MFADKKKQYVELCSYLLNIGLIVLQTLIHCLSIYEALPEQRKGSTCAAVHFPSQWQTFTSHYHVKLFSINCGSETKRAWALHGLPSTWHKPRFIFWGDAVLWVSHGCVHKCPPPWLGAVGNTASAPLSWVVIAALVSRGHCDFVSVQRLLIPSWSSLSNIISVFSQELS